MCELCCKLQKKSPKAFARFQRAATNPKPTRDLALIGAAYELAEQVVNEIGAKTLLGKLDEEGEFEIGLDGFTSNIKLSRGDHALVSLCLEHAVSDLLNKHRLLATTMGTA
jgi:hypothetical protein